MSRSFSGTLRIDPPVCRYRRHCSGRIERQCKLLPQRADIGLRGNRATQFWPKSTPTPADIVRALELDAKFRQLEPGLVDGTVAAVAERWKVHRVLTIDRRHFGATLERFEWPATGSQSRTAPIIKIASAALHYHAPARPSSSSGARDSPPPPTPVCSSTPHAARRFAGYWRPAR